jgi:hypothetical protein
VRDIRGERGKKGKVGGKENYGGKKVRFLGCGES